jgi:hypothetical protein
VALAAARLPPPGRGGAGPVAGPAADPAATLVAAVADLYRACHLPPPAVVVAPDAVRFARAAYTVSRRIGPGQAMAAFVALSLSLPTATALLGDVASGSFCLFMAVSLLPLLRVLGRMERRSGGNVRWFLLQLLATAALGGAAVAVARLCGQDPHGAFAPAGGAVGALAVGQLLADASEPIRARRRVLRTAVPSGPAPSRRIALLGAAPAAPVVLPRVATALDEAGLDRLGVPAGPRDAAQLFPGPAQEALRSAIEAETRRLGVFASDPDLAFGRSAGRPFTTAERVSRLAGADPEPAGLPRVLRAAVALDGLVEAVCLLHGLAVVLPAGAPAELAVVPLPLAGGGWRRSRRAAWHAPSQWLDEDPLFAMALDLAPTDGIADRLLARRVSAMPEAARRTPAIRAMGIGRCVGALRLRPVQRDACGALYMIGAREDPSAFVAVEDRVLGPDGAPLEHWIGVPPHVATAREAVAWSFGMGEADYRPAREA